ncbi:MAG TPA: class I SAM-dependent methyltransferase [Thermoanaerobaculia bacterium]|nr:class I SAM-dependent methyltransferase [Thermoanaerobaculia bacterium]
MPRSAFDTTAPQYDRYRALPEGVPEQIRSAVLGLAASKPSVLDLGAGTGRIGKPFVAAGDDYTGVDQSYGMLHEFRAPRLAQCDGESLPFRDGSFDVVMLISVVGAARGWRRVLAEARRVVRGAIVIGKTVGPADGVDARMKQRLAAILEELGVPPEEKRGDKALAWLESTSTEKRVVTAASWTSERSPRGFLDRKPTGAKFSELSADIQKEALRRLTGWASETYGSLEAVRPEAYSFELTVFK